MSIAAENIPSSILATRLQMIGNNGLLYYHNPIAAAHLQNPKGNVVISRKEQTTTVEEKKLPASFPKPENPSNDEWVVKNTDIKTNESAEDSVLEIKMPEIKEASPNDLLFTPYHTVDYFASQGINLKATEKPADKFGEQLKSFTEWLKVLKKAPNSPLSSSGNPATDTKVDQLAATSISNNEVVTEAMAEIWRKQGEKSKAIAIYSKLSLQNPDKSAYFASLIEQIKN